MCEIFFLLRDRKQKTCLSSIYSSGRRYVVQRHFEQQLFDIKSLLIQNNWRRCLLEVISNSLSPIYITLNEVQLMHEIFSWHLNYSNNYIKLRENIDYIIDFEDLIDCFNSLSFDDDNSNNNLKSFIIQPVTTLDAARKNIEMWKNLQENIIEKNTNQTIDKRVNRERTRIPSKILFSFKGKGFDIFNIRELGGFDRVYLSQPEDGGRWLDETVWVRMLN